MGSNTEQLSFDDLKHGDVVEFYWHFSPLSFDFFWKRGKVWCLLGGGKLFVPDVPDDGLAKVQIFPHYMGGVRKPKILNDAKSEQKND